MDYNLDQRAIKSMFESQGMRPTSVRLLHDDQGRSKGAAFVDFENSDAARHACSLDGKKVGGAMRPLRVNSAKR